MMTGLQRLAAWLFQSDHSATVPTVGSAESATTFDFIPHGNHWQNLLSCPMDARHYVMEDWSL
ncbi:hypothetical protein [Burkholderia sp. WAC0059]|uniref:hypothetical protein n=1 Tax=Burkholderia sp. WAC0059 TaxID=2066022 RepID=UPI0026C4E609